MYRRRGFGRYLLMRVTAAVCCAIVCAVLYRVL
jgi:succinate dehydrogenase hydrophobic anchor subunit